MALDWMPVRLSILANLSAPCLVRVKTSTCCASESSSRSISSRLFSAFSAKWTRCEMVSTTEAGGVTVTSTGSCRILAASWAMSGGIVAEKKSVCRRAGSSGRMRRMSWMKPMSSMRSASSRTKKRTLSSEIWPCPTRSSRRPGVATSRSTPRCSTSTCGRWLTPPKITQWRTAR